MMNQFVNNSFFVNVNRISTQLVKHGEFSPFIIQKIVSTGNIDLIKNSNLEKLGKECFEDTVQDAKKYAIDLLKGYKQYDLEVLKIDLQNRYNLKEKDVDALLEDLKDKVKISKDTISLE